MKTFNQSGKPRVLVLTGELLDVDMATLAVIEEFADVTVATSRESLAVEIETAEIMLVWDFRFADLDELLPTARHLRWIHAASVGVEALLTPNLTKQGIVLTNSRGVFDTAIAEYVLGAYLAHVKGFRRTWELESQKRWEHRITERIEGKSAVVVGTGSIGRTIAGLLHAAGMQVALVGRRPGVDPVYGPIATSAELESIAPEVDLLVLAAPLTPSSRHMVSRGVLEALHPDSYLVNVGRGALIDEAALIDVLAKGGFAGATLDVFEEEPLGAQSQLWTEPRVVVSPHMSADFHGFDVALVDVFLGNLRKWLATEPLEGVVDHQLGYVPSTMT